MSAGYRAVQWNSYKVRYDLAVTAGVLAYVGIFLAVSLATHRGGHAIGPPVLLMRAFGTCAFVMLHVVSCIGPLARLDRRFLPLLYNRRHLGVATFCVAVVHAGVAVGFYHGFGVVSAPLSLLTSNTEYRSISGFPFEALGLVALMILFLMAATSHDFWLKFLSPRVWKSLHMAVYVAWAAVVLHVPLGAMQSEKSPLYPALVFTGVVVVCTLHVVAGWREMRRDRCVASGANPDWIVVCDVDEIPTNRAAIASSPGGERIAVFRHGNCISAVTNVCAHQGGPLGEGRIIAGCITCPWHGYQYRPSNGRAPSPFTERIHTYNVKIEHGRVMVAATPNPPGTAVEPAIVPPEQRCNVERKVTPLTASHTSSGI